ncbi:hypothetical protein FSP39_021685 [Pinctada imbricata]|uniref:SprT-like domain-containing protein n=1 Tax=Pinctada imbricata TaxID=66713 RepID=A0AA88YJB8_PINIB|nr:hypothetical protein FSP39_021685 [Pinctada imbricata]
MDESKDEIVDDDTPTRLLPPSSHASSTPYNAGFKPDVAELFQKMGKKLGWFQYDDINSAIRSSQKSEPMEMNSDNDLPDIETKDEDSKSENTKWRTKENFNSESSDDDLETFFQKMRTPMKDKNPSQAPKDSSKDDSMDDFIVDDNDASSGSEDELFYITTTSKLPSPKQPNKKPDPVTCLSSDDEEDSVFKTPGVSTKTKAKTSKIKTPRKPISDFVCDTEERFSFLKSLSSNVQDDKCNRDALRFKKNFKKMKEELTGKLYTLYNETIFDNQLPEDLNIIWNKRLLRTAGYCVYKRNASVKNSNSVRIELSTKVCDSTERVRDTLIHELCHAAVWLLHGKNDGHGPYWRLWAQKANLTHPELPVINRCHSYSIATKYTYQCSKCGYQVGRHSKSLDTKRKVCGYCHGEFVLLSNKPGSGSATSTSSTPATPRAPNKFALFVKENYGKVKGQQKDLRHGDIMKVLSKEFSEKNKIT